MSYLARQVPRYIRKVPTRCFSSAKTEVDEQSFSSSARSKKQVKEQKPALDLKTFNLKARTVPKSPAPPPLMKGVFSGDINEQYFPFLEVLQKEHVDKFLAERSARTTEYNAKARDMNGLKELGLFGVNIPQEYRGRGYDVTEVTLNSEIEAENAQAAAMLQSHRIVTQLITEFGTDEQKERYLRRLAEGELIGTVAIFEKNPEDDLPYVTKAIPTNDGFVLTGQKEFVMNSQKANLFLVFSTTMMNFHSRDSRTGVTVFLVDGNEPGITKGEPVQTLGMETVQQSTVTFKNTPIRHENVLGEAHNAEPIALKMLRATRLQKAVSAIQLHKRILNNFTKYCIETPHVGGKAMDWDAYQVRLGRIACEIYAAESMLYFTTSLMDAYDQADVEIEAASTAVYALESLLRTAELPFMSMGTEATTDINAQNIRDAIQLTAQGEAMDTIRLFIGFMGVQQSGEVYADYVDKARNPLMHKDTFFTNLFRKPAYDGIKLDKQFIRFLHPSLEPAAEMLEVAMKRLNIGIVLSLSRHGRGIVDAQTEVMRIAHCSTLLYSCFAAMSRASRSYCIGVRYSDMEIMLANTHMLSTLKEIKKLTDELEEGVNHTNDMNHKNIARQLFESKGYFYEHPLTRIF